jgi:uncharacterized damage-inducible protein DinB
MYHNVQEFLGAYEQESGVTERVLRALTDEALAQSKGSGHHNAGDIAWHIATAPNYMFNQIGWPLTKIEGWATPENITAAQIVEQYCKTRDELKHAATNVTPEDLQKVHHVFGQLDWPAWMMLSAQIVHEAHHRGQLSVLMRQAGLTVPSIYGPNFEDTVEMMKAMQAQ